MKVQEIREKLGIITKKEKNRGTLWASVQARRIVEFYYHGSYRTVEPYALGVTRHGDADNESLVCYQLSGLSDLDEATGWRLYRVSEMEDIQVSREQFDGDRPGYDPENLRLAEVFCCVCPVRPVQQEVIETPEPLEVEPPPVIPVPQLTAPPFITHNEVMRQLRLSHPPHNREGEAYAPSGPRPQSPPERPEWEKRHFSEEYREKLAGETNHPKFKAPNPA